MIFAGLAAVGACLETAVVSASHHGGVGPWTVAAAVLLVVLVSTFAAPAIGVAATLIVFVALLAVLTAASLTRWPGRAGA